MHTDCFTATVAEMFVQSTATDLYLLPALPRDKWPDGCVKGLKAFGRVTVSVCWVQGKLNEVGLWWEDDVAVRTLHYDGLKAMAELVPGKVYTFNDQLQCTRTNSLRIQQTGPFSSFLLRLLHFLIGEFGWRATITYFTVQQIIIQGLNFFLSSFINAY